MEYDDDEATRAEEWRLQRLYEAIDNAESVQGKSAL